ncbi:MAG: NAD(P)-dependent oxidoreductase [Rhodospirillales bacterium]|nr:NAD(P)-dependent oxidoreductase [Rhodospirillales bacterium]MBO6786884.1 NAD(P)-dependent oxidoreductase [Rhodospirillales bacterium]
MTTAAFIGLGVMGEPMCRNLTHKRETAGLDEVRAFDVREEPLARLAEQGAVASASARDAATGADVVFVSLPGGKEVEDILTGSGGLLDAMKPGAVFVDLSTSPVTLSRELAEKAEAKGIQYADAPVARTRQAAEQGTLAIMVGSSDDIFRRIKPLLDCVASDVLHCGGVGCGQMVKILNNMVLFQNVVALSEALTVARHAGMDGDVLFNALTQGSGDSFALRNHGMKALLPGEFPLQAFSTVYAQKDLSYALALADDIGRRLPGAENVKALFEQTIEAGFGDNYWPAVVNVIDKPRD